MRHLKAFHVFHTAAQSSSYSETANKLHITHGAVSKQIKQLESYLSQTLFCKQGRTMRLTQEGLLLQQYTSVAFEALYSGVNKLKKNKSSHLELSCEPSLTMRWLMPRLSNFYHASGIDVRLSTAGGPVVLEDAGLSMAIRRDDFEIASEYVVHPLVDEWIGPVFSPEYWNRVQNHVNDIVLLHSETRINAWQLWANACNKRLHLNASNQYFGHFYFCLQAAVDGLGAAIGSYPLVADDIKNGRLVAPFGYILSGHRYVLLQQSPAEGEKELQLQHWLEKEMSDCIPINS